MMCCDASATQRTSNSHGSMEGPIKTDSMVHMVLPRALLGTGMTSMKCTSDSERHMHATGMHIKYQEPP